MAENKHVAIKNSIRKHANDTGSSGVQVVALSQEIEHLSGHMTANKKDFACRRSLLKKVAVRKKFLSYLKRTDEKMYKEVISTLGLKR